MTDIHIQMPDVAPLVRYLGDGTRTVFSYPFPIFATSDLSVTFDGAPQYAGFAVGGAGMTGGGAVTFTAAPARGVTVTLARLLPLQRVTDFIEGGDFSAQALNTELDYLTAGGPAGQKRSGANAALQRRRGASECQAAIESGTRRAGARLRCGWQPDCRLAGRQHGAAELYRKRDRCGDPHNGG